MSEKFYVNEKILRTRNCRRRFIKNLVPEKRNENFAGSEDHVCFHDLAPKSNSALFG